MSDLGTRNAARLARRGTPTTVNGQTINAVWARSQPNRVTMFVGETLEGTADYTAEFPVSVISAPYSLTNGMTVVWLSTGWSFKVRNLIPIDRNGTLAGYTAILEAQTA